MTNIGNPRRRVGLNKVHSSLVGGPFISHGPLEAGSSFRNCLCVLTRSMCPADDAMDDEDADEDEEPSPAAKPAGKKGAASEPKAKEKLFKVRPLSPSAAGRISGVTFEQSAST